MNAPSRWLVLRARLSGGAVDDGMLAQALLDLGGRAVEFTDGWSVTHLSQGDVDTDDARIWRNRIAAVLPPWPVEVEVAWQEHGDWAELWKRGLEPRRVTDRLVVTPTWCEPELRPGDLVITLDPGMAFGNAEHGTTRGCLRLLDGVVREGDIVLDVGAGSAVLSVAAALLGAARVTAIEADPLALPAALDNVAANGVADRVQVIEARVAPGDLYELAGARPYDGIVANIESGILEPLLTGFAQLLRPGGWLILSGIPAPEWTAMVTAAESVGFAHVATDADGEWRSGRFTRV